MISAVTAPQQASSLTPQRRLRSDQPLFWRMACGSAVPLAGSDSTYRWIPWEAREVKYAIRLPRCHRFRANEVRIWLSVVAYNLGNLWRRLALPARIGKWSLTSLQQRLVKTGGRLIQHARYYWLLLAESHLTRRLFGNMLQKIAALPSPAG
jgi:hypothetical protein